jgi:hypothetical protein
MDLTLLVALFPNPPVLWFESTYSRFGRALNRARNHEKVAAAKKQEEEEKISYLDDVSDINRHCQEEGVCPKRIAEEYLRQCGAKAWKKENTIDSQKCFNLERILEAEMAGDSAPAPITLEEFEAEAAEFGV